jgi:hypothetical protein
MLTVKTCENNGFSPIELVRLIVLLAILSIVAPEHFADQEAPAAKGVSAKPL